MNLMALGSKAAIADHRFESQQSQMMFQEKDCQPEIVKFSNWGPAWLRGSILASHPEQPRV